MRIKSRPTAEEPISDEEQPIDTDLLDIGGIYTTVEYIDFEWYEDEDNQ